MDCDIEDLARNFSDIIFEEFCSMKNFENSSKQISDLVKDYQASGAAVGTILGVMAKELKGKKLDEILKFIFTELSMNFSIHPIDFWGVLEEILLCKCSELKEHFYRIQGSNKDRKMFGMLSKMLVFAGNTVTGGMLGEAKTFFEGLFSFFSQVSEQVAAPKSFEELCAKWVEYSFCLKMINDLRSKRIYFPILGTKGLKALFWTKYFVLSTIGLHQNLENFYNYKDIWEGYINIIVGEMEKGIVDHNLNLTIYGVQQGYKGTYYDNSIPKVIWKEIKGFYNDLPIGTH